MAEGLVKLDAGNFELRGPLNLASVGRLQREGRREFAATTQAVSVDLSGVSVADSAGLALLMDWLAWAVSSRHQLSFHNVPDALLALAGISEVQDLLLPRGQPTPVLPA